MRLIRIAIFLFLSIAFYCTNKNDIALQFLTSEVIDSVITIAADTRTNFFSLNSTVYYDGKNQYLVRVNELTNSLQFYSDNKIDFQIQFQNAGPHGIGVLRAAYVVSMDSIIILPKFANRLYIGNSKGEIYKLINLPADKMIGGTYGFILSYSPAPIVKVGSSLFVKVSQFFDMCDPRNNYPTSSLIAKIDLEKETISNIISPPTEVYQNKIWSDDYYFYVSHTYDEENKTLNISFPISPYVYAYHVEKETITKKYLGTNKIDNIKSLSHYECVQMEGNEKETIEGLRSSFYGFLVYDPAQKLFYRFYHLPADENLKIPEIDVNPSSHLSAHPTGVIVADENLNILVDIMLPDYTFNTYDFFITNDGLWLSHHNEFRKQQDQDKMQFSLLKLK